MKRHRGIVTLSTLLLIAVVAWTASCKSKTTNPPVTKELDSGNIAASGTYQHTFANAGTYNYHCTIHGAGMAGSVTVAAGQPMSVAVAIGNNFFNPANVSVAPTGTVTWTNGGSTHTVTSN